MRRGFTLIELLIVISIIMLLVGMIASASVVLIRRATNERARALLVKVSTAIEAYQQDRSHLPAWQNTWADGSWTWVDANAVMLHTELLTTDADHRGNARKGYLIGEVQTKDVVDGRIVDPWGKPLIYYTAPWSGPKPYPGNDRAFELWSAGRDGSFGDLRSASATDADNLPANAYDPKAQR
jgi:prepilin-type N-terminal cleavage/methylation domain-containing protein